MSLFQHHGKTLHYTIENNAFREDVFFIHGNLASTRWWQPAFEQLGREQDATMQGRLVAADWVGCGKSSAPRNSDDLVMRSLAMDHIALIRAIGLTNVHLVGHSTGGLIALYAMMLAPELFTKALLLDPVSAEGVKLSPEVIEAFKKMSTDRAFCEIVMSSTVHGRDPKDPIMQGIVSDAFGVNPMIWTEIPKHLTDVDIRREIKRITQPTLVLHGELDQVLPEAGSREIAKLIPGARFELLKGRGHSTNVEDPALFVEKMKGFFL
jgi:3-oxoadipate enol-lactonase